ncbi:hypothetical protein EVAR_30969_1 [Eumeta japonica]|uniref:Uncharacterized protein n=1 Tax=Eumeta variegata TaxID=151549 RepID=A0A4C1W9V8_EUMVA|nr:hypothetical protein EVAR_30969_1 [Eumeta japonica]
MSERDIWNNVAVLFETGVLNFSRLLFIEGRHRMKTARAASVWYGTEDLLLFSCLLMRLFVGDTTPTDPMQMAPFQESNSWTFPDSAGDPEEVSVDSPSSSSIDTAGSGSMMKWYGTEDLMLPHARGVSSRRGYSPDGSGGNGHFSRGSIVDDFVPVPSPSHPRARARQRAFANRQVEGHPA